MQLAKEGGLHLDAHTIYGDTLVTLVMNVLQESDWLIIDEVNSAASQGCSHGQFRCPTQKLKLGHGISSGKFVKGIAVLSLDMS